MMLGSRRVACENRTIEGTPTDTPAEFVTERGDRDRLRMLVVLAAMVAATDQIGFPLQLHQSLVPTAVACSRWGRRCSPLRH